MTVAPAEAGAAGLPGRASPRSQRPRPSPGRRARLPGGPAFPTCSRVTEPASNLQDPPYLKGLNPPQREAVLTTDGPVLVLAGAGTGKTAALTARLAHLLWTRKAYPSEILSVTFTNKAAREMRHRVGQLVGDVVEGMPWLGTFHAIGAKMLRRHAELVGLQSNFTILDTDDQLRLLKQLIVAADLDEKRWPARSLAGLIDQWKNKGLTPRDIDAGESERYANGRGGELYAAYQDRLKALNACDFGDLLLHMLVILKTHRDVLEHYQQRFRYIMVDEYQDTNSVQYLWLRLLAQERRNLCCVGDDDQSIYSWRGAQVENILKFEKDFPGAKVIKLEQNYRCTPHILAAASGRHRQQRRAPRQDAVDRGSRTARRSRSSASGTAPRKRAASARRSRRASAAASRSTKSPILVRAQHQTREFEDRFIAIGMPYRIVGGFRFYERAEIRDALAYLRVVAQPADDLAFERIVNVPKRGLGDKAVAKVHQLARAQGIPLTTAAARILDTDELTPQARRALGNLVGDIARWRDMGDDPAPRRTRPASSSTKAATPRCTRPRNPPKPPAASKTSPNSSARWRNTRPSARSSNTSAWSWTTKGNADDPKVTIMTIHAAKGLEYDTVFLVGWEEGLFPSQRALDEGGTASLEEERRLAYVAITRARRRAVIIHAANRRIYGQWTSSIPSRFVGELPERAYRERNHDVRRREPVAGQLERTRRPLRRRRARHRPRPRLATRRGRAT